MLRNTSSHPLNVEYEREMALSFLQQNKKEINAQLNIDIKIKSPSQSVIIRIAQAEKRLKWLEQPEIKKAVLASSYPLDLAEGFVKISLFDALQDDASFETLSHHQNPIEAANALVMLNFLVKGFAINYKAIVANHPNPMSIMTEITYQAHIQHFLQNEIERLPKGSNKANALHTIAKSLNDGGFHSMQKLKSLMGQVQETVKKHNDTGWLGFFKATSQRYPESYKHFLNHFDKQNNLRKVC